MGQGARVTRPSQGLGDDRGKNASRRSWASDGWGAELLSAGGWEIEHSDLPRLGYFEHLVDHAVHGVWTKMVEHLEEEFEARPTVHARQNHQAGVDVLPRNQPAEVSRVLRDEDQVVPDAAGQHLVIALAHAAVVARMDDDLRTAPVELVNQAG